MEALVAGGFAIGLAVVEKQSVLRVKTAGSHGLIDGRRRFFHA